MAQKLNNYLLTYRKRAGLSQDEMAFLLGTVSGTRVSRYERFGREPGLQTALAYEIIFAAAQQDLFAGLYEEVERGVLFRAGRLLEHLDGARVSPPVRQKLEALQGVISKNS